jgi:cytochrome c-type biogenesis protein
VILFGLNYLGVLKLNLFRGMAGNAKTEHMTFGSAFLFGLVFSVGWSPCVGTFLGTALMLASQQGSAALGMGMLLSYSLGLGVPFLVSAVLIEQLKGAFAFIKRNYDIINKICGSMLILVGLLMATGLLNRLLNLLR